MAVSELKFVPASEFKQRTGAAVADPHLRRSFRTAMACVRVINAAASASGGLARGRG